MTALSPPTVRGQWGEISLRRLVELAGLSAKCDFVEQEIIDAEQGRLRPDMVVHLPRDRDVVIDCKTCLDAFLDAAAAVDEDTRKTHLRATAQQVRSRARELSAKSYWSQFSRSPEYVIMFLPGEAFLYAAVDQDGSLVEDCIKNHVLIATPHDADRAAQDHRIRLAARADRRKRRANPPLGIDLYERIGTVLTHIAKLGGSLNMAVTNYNSVLGSLESRVMPTSRKMAEFGARRQGIAPTRSDRAIAAQSQRASVTRPADFSRQVLWIALKQFTWPHRSTYPSPSKTSSPPTSTSRMRSTAVPARIPFN